MYGRKGIRKTGMEEELKVQKFRKNKSTKQKMLRKKKYEDRNSC